MSQENLEQFRETVFAERSLQKELREVREQEAFIKAVVRLGEKHGYRFTAEDVEEALRANRRAWLMRWV